MNHTQKTLIEDLKHTQPQTYEAIQSLLDQKQKELSFASHEIKNHLSFMNSAYQLISKKECNLTEIPYWKKLGDSIQKMIGFMERTSTYRYGSKCALQPLNITELLYTLPDVLDDIFPEQSRLFTFDVVPEPVMIAGDMEQLTTLFVEILTNCYEATSENDTIHIHSALQDDASVLAITITNSGTLTAPILSNPIMEMYDTLPEKLCAPFCTTKPEHTGLGLAICSQICTMHHAHLQLSAQATEVSVKIKIPVIG